MAVRRKELLFRGPIEVAGTVVQGAELRSNGSLYAVFVGDDLISHMQEPTITYGRVGEAGAMSLTAVDGSETWRVSSPEQVTLTWRNMTVKRGTAPALRKATISQSQYRVRVEAPGVDESFDGATIETINGKRAIVTPGGEIMMLENGGGSCCGS